MSAGFGKVILFGEHFVVYGLPGIVSGLPEVKTELQIREGPWKIIGPKNIIDVIDEEKAINAAMEMVNYLGVNKSYTIEVLRSVPVQRNLGSSAAFCAAFVRAVNEKENLGLTEEQLNVAAYKGEVYFHGTPSGIDNSAAIYGKPLIFKLTKKGFDIQAIRISKSLHVVLTYTGKKIKGTAELVEEVRVLKEKEPLVNKYFTLYESLYQEAKTSIENGNLVRVGRLMDLNHGLLTAFGLTTSRIEEARTLLKGLGALGVKITGAGGGGNIVALFENRIQAKHAVLKMNHWGFESFYSEIKSTL